MTIQLAKMAVDFFHGSRGWAPIVLWLAAGLEWDDATRDMFDIFSLPFIWSITLYMDEGVIFRLPFICGLSWSLVIFVGAGECRVMGACLGGIFICCSGLIPVFL